MYWGTALVVLVGVVDVVVVVVVVLAVVVVVVVLTVVVVVVDVVDRVVWLLVDVVAEVCEPVLLLMTLVELVDPDDCPPDCVVGGAADAVVLDVLELEDLDEEDNTLGVAELDALAVVDKAVDVELESAVPELLVLVDCCEVELAVWVTEVRDVTSVLLTLVDVDVVL